MTSAELAELVVADADALRTWLSANHTSSPGVWLALTKKGGTVTTLTWQQAVDEALCFGWIDGQARKRDEESSWIRFTPRRPRSAWSQRNVANVARLEEQGRMAPAGRAVVEAAKADGRWAAAYAPPSEAEVPADLLAAIAAEPAAQAMLDVLTKANRFALIHRLNAVKRVETRERKIVEFVAMLARHETFYPQKARPLPAGEVVASRSGKERTD
ncbi:YdeI/OmpD-associated family protein [Micromonospora sp. WMMD961]|uniref:YdeI/OmpD-associated family protein n=1 Tax=Micromonospora sp. WMMD961 TaxID=3016100 RepID=UPI0024170575|nr:YdeI/OmpD-associated family protein [Micromonospora sp. WMMD961]MDG4779932.1 YdeI/OmpD-associated family protein [Micromonospora sp. WMMD961]